VLFGVGYSLVRGAFELVPLALTVASPEAAEVVRYLVVAPLSQTVWALLGAAGVASVYFELRTIKEGVGAEALARAFD
jgi:hypothetical protein